MTEEQAVRARRAEQHVLADRQQIAHKIEAAADNGRGNVIKHSGHTLKDGSKGLPHYQAEGRKGHTFWGTLSIAALAIAGGLDNVAEASEAFDPLNYLSSGDPGEIENHERIWFGAYKQIDPNGIDFIEAFKQKQDRAKEESLRRQEERRRQERASGGR